MGSVAQLLIIPHLADFQTRFPDIQLDLGVSDRTVDLIGDNVDCVIRGGELSDQSLVARRIATLVEQHVHDKPREWRPLVYCWRGGQRSGSLSLVLSQIGFRVAQLEGGYRAFRALVREQLDALAAGGRERIDHVRLDAEQSEFEDLEQADGACADDDDVRFVIPPTHEPSR